MGRMVKKGLDYFPLDVKFFDDVKIRKMRKRAGLESVPVLLYLLCQIYGQEGYYMIWDEDSIFFCADDLGLEEEKVTAVVQAALQFDVFSTEMFQRHGILTSRGIQERYLEAANRRKSPGIEEKFQLISVDINPVNDSPKSFSVEKSEHKSDLCMQKSDLYRQKSDLCMQKSIKESKEKKSKEKDSKEKENKEKVFSAGNNPAVAFFQNNFHPFTGEYESQSFLDLIDDYGERWVMDAMKIAVRNNALNLKFVSKVLENWQKFGYGNKAPVTNWRDGHGSNTESDFYGNVFDERCAEPLGSRTN